MAIITISENLDGLGNEIATKVSQRLGFSLVDSTLMLRDLIDTGSLDNKSLFDYVSKKKIPPEIIKNLIIEKALRDNVVILNLGGEVLFRKLPGTLHVKVRDSNSYRADKRALTQTRKNYISFMRTLFRKEKIGAEFYDIQIMLERLDTDFAVDLILAAVETKGITMKAGITWKALQLLKSSLRKKEKRFNAAKYVKKFIMPSFAHHSEKEFAKVLDFYRIKWEYEPRSFLLKADKNGMVKEEFTPDFYLPELDLYIELTTLKQKLVTKKNRKLRRLKKLYPNVNIKLFYGRDYNKLLQRFGIR
jgi:hypothetical protein